MKHCLGSPVEDRVVCEFGAHVMWQGLYRVPESPLKSKEPVVADLMIGIIPTAPFKCSCRFQFKDQPVVQLAYLTKLA